MPISYTKRGWTNNSPPAINAANLGAMDDGIKQACDAVDQLMQAPVAHAASHKHGGADEIATATPAANAIPKADASGKLDTWISDATTSTKGKVQLATAAELEAGTDASKALTPAVVRPATIKRTKMPDGATAVYSQDAWATSDGWIVYGGSGVSITTGDGVLRATVTSSGSSGHIYRNIGSSALNKYFMVRIRANRSGIQLNLGTYSYPVYLVFNSSTEWQTVVVRTAVYDSWASNAYYIGVGIYGAATANDWFEIDWVWLGSSLYQTGTQDEISASDLNLIANTPAVGVAATGTITSSGVNSGTAGKKILIHGKPYTLYDGTPSVEGQIKLGATAQETITNYMNGINADTGTFGVTHYCSTAHQLVIASAASLVLTITAKSAGELGNLILLSTDEPTFTVSGSQLSGGYSATAKKLQTLVAPIIAGNGTRPAAALIELTDTTKIGYEHAVDVASGGTVTLPSGGTWLWFVYGYGATISGSKKGSSAGGTVLTVAGANATVWYRRYA